MLQQLSSTKTFHVLQIVFTKKKTIAIVCHHKGCLWQDALYSKHKYPVSGSSPAVEVCQISRAGFVLEFVMGNIGPVGNVYNSYRQQKLPWWKCLAELIDFVSEQQP